MKLVFLIFFSFYLNSFAQETSGERKNTIDPLDINNSFITKFEYGKMLYNNPRGIGCNSCHGNDAKGKKIIAFKHKYRKKSYDCELIVPSIKEVEYEVFSKKVNAKKNSNKKFKKEEVCKKLIYYANVMPTYFMVEEEIEAIYYYIKNLK